MGKTAECNSCTLLYAFQGILNIFLEAIDSLHQKTPLVRCPLVVFGYGLETVRARTPQTPMRVYSFGKFSQGYILRLVQQLDFGLKKSILPV